MKPTRRKKVLGIALGERSLLAAEVVAGGDRPQVTRLGELVYPEGVSPNTPEELGKALGDFLRDQQFTARQAVVGLPARWLVVKAREVPPSDPATVTEMLRLGAEAEFPSDIKDLVFDFPGELDDETRSVLLVATPRKYVDSAVTFCEGARVRAVAVTSSAVALGQATGRSMGNEALVLAVAPSGSEMTAQKDGTPNSLRHLRPPTPQPPFVSELRRALLTMPHGNGERELILWDGAGLDAASLGTNLGITVRSGDLPALGVNTNGASVNGEGRKYAAAVALGLWGIGLGESSVDFLHSRLAPPRQSRVPRWAIIATITGLAIIIGSVYAYNSQQQAQAKLTDAQTRLVGMKDEITVADAFVKKVSFAQAWHGGDPRYLACLRDLTQAVPEDFATYATNLVLHETPKPPVSTSLSPAAAAAAAKQAEIHTLTGQLYGKTLDQPKVEMLLDRIKQVPTFTDVKLGGANASKAGEVSFNITFTYVPPKAAQ